VHSTPFNSLKGVECTVLSSIQAFQISVNNGYFSGSQLAGSVEPLWVHAQRTWFHAFNDSGGRLLGGVYASPDPGRLQVLVAARFEGGPVFLLRVDALREAQEAAIRIAELTCMALCHIDMRQAQAEVEGALSALEIAIKRRKAAEVEVQVLLLLKYPCIKATHLPLANVLPMLENEKTQVTVVNALAATGDPAVRPFLFRMFKHLRKAERPAVRRALLEAFGLMRGQKELSVLLDRARRGTAGESVVAIRSLGYYDSNRGRVLLELSKLMGKAESAWRKGDTRTRERWEKVEPEIRQTVKQLTGEVFSNAADLRTWIRKNR